MLLDTCIVIDLLRGRESAVAFITGLSSRPALSVITVTEVVAGARNARERREIDQFVRACQSCEIDLEIATLAGDYVSKYGRSHGVDPIDALIAATAKSRNLELATLNLKHFPMFEALARPYPA
ncbi:hypothetical protein VE25_01860 [Devosia geojensis]|uniref:Ribonuclease VapC n=1 Tax=Devosia geojensis TaxID=443610 RepID=A0A0F5FY42_9HYPH|nr:type II toxin-antitoxin system VapC family toxin [Devosia geojensis]KKB13495.1 hypothetical protein VE25_01860 [Devosia geojensis]